MKFPGATSTSNYDWDSLQPSDFKRNTRGRQNDVHVVMA